MQVSQSDCEIRNNCDKILPNFHFHFHFHFTLICAKSAIFCGTICQFIAKMAINEEARVYNKDSSSCVRETSTNPVSLVSLTARNEPPLRFHEKLRSTNYGSGGYDEYFDPPLENKYECSICLLGLREPVQTRCGHRFCGGCILRSLR